MVHAQYMKTVMGGLSLVLLLSACSSGAKSKTTTAPPSGDISRGGTATTSPPSDLPRSDVVSDRGTTRAKTYDSTSRAGLSDRSPGATPASDGAGLAAACSSRVDANGKVIYDDPACPDRFRSQVGTTSEKERAGLAAACSSKSDANGKVIYDDPACPDRYRQQNASMNAIREARVRLSRAAGIKTWDFQPGDKLTRPDPVGVAGAGDCPSKVDANGKVIYADSGCAHRYYYQTKENAFYDRYADKAAKHARAAEIAANEGNMPDMIEDAELSLDHAKEARRANNNPDLAAGIAALRQSIALAQTNEVPGSRVGNRAQTVKGELSRSAGGGEQYVVRDSQNREMPITLSPEMSRQVQVGDVVEAQVDSNGQVTSISKAP